MEVVYNSLVDVNLNDELYNNYVIPDDRDILTFILEFPNIIKNSYIKERLKQMITTK